MRNLRCLALVTALVTPLLANDAYEITTAGKPGTGALVPTLNGTGPATPASTTNALVLHDALPDSTAIGIVGFSELAAPFKGGVLGPTPDLLLFGLPIDAAGALSLPFAIPLDIPIGTELWTQFWIDDAGALLGRSASNSLKLTVQPVALSFSNTYYMVGAFPHQTAIGDFDNNGTPDIAIDAGFGTFSIIYGNGDGTFGNLRIVDSAGSTDDMTTVDIDADGDLDLLAYSNEFDSLATFVVGGPGSFFPPILSPASPHFYRDIDFADLNADGTLDVALAAGSREVGASVMLGVGDGSFGPPTSFPTGGGPLDVALADFNGDGAPDIAAVHFLESEVAILLSDGNGSFGAPTIYPAGSHPDTIRAGDLNGDGTIDLALPGGFDAAIYLLFGAGDGSFGAPVAVPTLSETNSAEIMDVNQDGLPDLVSTGHALVGSIALHFGLGGGAFTGPHYVGSQSWAVHTAMADLDGDGDFDLVTAHDTAGFAIITVMLNDLH